MRPPRRLRLLLLACALGALARPVLAAPRVVRVVTDDNYPPFVFPGPDGKPRGYDVDLWKLWQRKTGIRVDFKAEHWARAQRDLLQGRADVIDLIFRTPERAPLYSFSAPSFELPVSIYVDHRIGGITSPSSLRGFEVGVERGDACVSHLRQLGIDSLRLYPDYQSLLSAARAGELKIFCMDDYPAEYYLYLDRSQLRYTRAFTLYTGRFRWAVRKGDAAMFRTVADGMRLITPQERRQLAAKWFKPAVRFAHYGRWLAPALLVLALATALVLLWVRSLRAAVRGATSELRHQAQLAEVERSRLHALIESSPDGIWLKDPDGVYLECNPQALQYIGKTRDQVVGRRDADVFEPDLAGRAAASDRAAMRAGGGSRSEESVRDARGELRELEVLKIPLGSPATGLRGVLGVSRDITERRRMEQTLRLWAEAFRNAGFALSISDARSNRYIDVNPAFAQQLGYTREELLGQPLTMVVPPDILPRYLRNRERADQQRHAVRESEVLRKDGSRLAVLLDITVLYGADGLPQQRIVYTMDISERRRAEQELRVAAAAFESQEGILVTDRRAIIRKVNTAFTRITGWSAEEAIGSHPRILRSEHHDARFYLGMARALARHGYWSGETWSRRKDGHPFLARLAISAVYDDQRAVLHYVGTMTDITEEREAKRTAERLTLHDPLTDLPNRRYLRDLLGNAIALSSRSGEWAALLMIDLDRFTEFNSLHGHQRGDLAMVMLAKRLRLGLRAGDVLGRFAGDQFAVLLEGLGGDGAQAAHRASRIATQLRDAAAQPFDLADRHLPGIGASVGVRVFGPADATADCDTLLAQTEAALRRAKQEGRNATRLFEPGLQRELDARNLLVEELRSAIAGRQLLLHLQPQFDRRGRIVAAEALVRWMHPTRGLLHPGSFIGVAEDSGLVDDLGRCVLDLACAHIADWSRRGALPGVSLSVNVSALQFRRDDFVDQLLRAVGAAAIEPGLLKLELTESMVMDDIEVAASRLEEIKRHGIRVSLDDFGTGSSSLSYLTQLPLDQLKIDKSFVHKLPHSRNDALVAQTILAMAKGLGLEVVAEGVETAPQLHFLRDHGCDLYQGYLLGRPVPAEEFVGLPGLAG